MVAGKEDEMRMLPRIHDSLKRVESHETNVYGHSIVHWIGLTKGCLSMGILERAKSAND